MTPLYSLDRASTHITYTARAAAGIIGMLLIGLAFLAGGLVVSVGSVALLLWLGVPG